MEPYIQLSLLNDFIFCPRSIYFHTLYAKYESHNYKESPQIVGTLKHENIDERRYSTSKNILQGMSVFCSKYNIAGKIDLFEIDTGKLIERKTKVKEIYDGYRYQLYGQYFSLLEMGYEVKELLIHSLLDNKRYKIDLPCKADVIEFEELLLKVRCFDLHQEFSQDKNRCENCIYSGLCDYYF